MLEGLRDLGAGPPPRKRRLRREAVFSIVAGDHEAKKFRSLPTLFLGRNRAYAHREVDAVCERLVLLAKKFLAGMREPIYALQPVGFGDSLGLYGADIFNRSATRLRLGRLGLSFSEEPCVQLTRRGTFRCDDWGEFSPKFLILAKDYSEGRHNLATGASVLFSAAAHRVGLPFEGELAHLARAMYKVKGIEAKDPEGIARSLSAAIHS